VWAPRRRRVELVLASRTVPLDDEGEGYFSTFVRGLVPGARYRYALDGEGPFPDPASRFQPDGPHGPSELVDPDAFAWTDGAWRGVEPADRIITEIHVGTFTREGTWRAATGHLAHLRDVGVRLVEVMPIADFPGAFGWGYDGVDLWAPTRLYGSPDDFRRFVDAAHALGMGVVLDVVYNHLGPDGNYLGQFSREYFTKRYACEWGEAINFDGEGAAGVRTFFVENAAYWIDEFHLDGLRFDATQSIHDASPAHVLADIARSAREAAGRRRLFLVAENESQAAKIARPESAGGYGLDALWNDDIHHALVVALTGKRDAYYKDYFGTPHELVAAARYGYLFQGQRFAWEKKARGTSALDLPASAFVSYLENHDQIANSATGARVAKRTTPGRWRAATAFLLLGPATPMMFQGQEFGATAPFYFFADHEPELAALVKKGRADFLAQFRALATGAARARLPDPAARATYEACKLEWDERRTHAAALALHKDLLALRAEDPAFRAQRADGVHGAVLGPEAFALRFCPSPDLDSHRLLVVNLGAERELEPAPEPILAPPDGGRWALVWSSDDPKYGGEGAPEVDVDGVLHLPGHAAVVLAPGPGGPTP
jgi:maltooligosyltrehalose trehalohydrolase